MNNYFAAAALAATCATALSQVENPGYIRTLPNRPDPTPDIIREAAIDQNGSLAYMVYDGMTTSLVAEDLIIEPVSGMLRYEESARISGTDVGTAIATRGPLVVVRSSSPPSNPSLTRLYVRNGSMGFNFTNPVETGVLPASVSNPGGRTPAFSSSHSIFELNGRTFVAIGDPAAARPNYPTGWVQSYALTQGLFQSSSAVQSFWAADGAVYIFEVTTSTQGFPSLTQIGGPVRRPQAATVVYPNATAFPMGQAFGSSLRTLTVNGIDYLAVGVPFADRPSSNLPNQDPNAPPVPGSVDIFLPQLQTAPGLPPIFFQRVATVSGTNPERSFGQSIKVSRNQLSIRSSLAQPLFVAFDGTTVTAYPRNLASMSQGIAGPVVGLPRYAGVTNGQLEAGSWNGTTWSRLLGPNVTASTITFEDGAGPYSLLRTSSPPNGSQYEFHVIALDQTTSERFEGGNVSGSATWEPQCTCVVNSTGACAITTAVGVPALSLGTVELRSEGLPVGAAHYFLVSPVKGFSALPGGSNGNLCLAGPIGRYIAPNQLQTAGPGGSVSLPISITTIPNPTGTSTVSPGMTLNFQGWYRDQGPMGSAVSNFTRAISFVAQ